MSRSLRGEAPGIPHLVMRRRGGLSGEILDLRLDIDEAFGRLEAELDNYVSVEDESSLVLLGRHKLNFTGSGVAAALDPVDPRKVNVAISGAGTGTGNIQTTVDYSQFSGPMLIGTVAAGRTIEKTTLEVLTAFNNGAQVSVGDGVAQGRLLTISDTALFRVGYVFLVESGYRYTVSTALYLFPVGATLPTVGSLRAVVYFS
jgi:hypothetical protein